MEVEIKAVGSWQSGRIEGFNGLRKADLIQEYRIWGLSKLKEAREDYEREVADMAREFGELHFVTLSLYTTFGDLLDALGEFETAKALRMRIRDQIQRTDGNNHPDYIQSTLNVAKSHVDVGEWIEARLLQEDVLKHSEKTYGAQSSVVIPIKSNLASIYKSQGEWKKAEELEIQVMQSLKSTLGNEHPSTLTSMANLASTFRNKGDGKRPRTWRCM